MTTRTCGCLSQNREYAEMEVVVYPLNSNAEAIKGNRNWKKDYAGMKGDLPRHHDQLGPDNAQRTPARVGR